MTTTIPTAEFLLNLTQVLNDLSSPGNERIIAEENLNSILTNSPSNTLLGLIQLGSSTNSVNEQIRILCFILLRRFTFKTLNLKDFNNPLKNQVWDLLKLSEQIYLKNQLLTSLIKSDKIKEIERRTICDFIAEVEKANSIRGLEWNELSITLSELFNSPSLVLRESVFRIYSESISLLESQPIPSVIIGLTSGLKDSSPGVRLSALTAAVTLITNAEPGRIEQFTSLIPAMLEVLVPFANERSEARLSTALLSFIDLASTPKVPSRVLKAHLPAILDFCLSIISPSPYQTSPSYSTTPFDETVRTSAIELLLSIADTAPSMTKLLLEFPLKLVPTLLNIIGEKEDDQDWLEVEDFNDDNDESMSVVGEGALDRLSRALGPVVFAPFMQSLGPLLNSSHWQHRHAGLSSIASIAEGCIEEINEQLPNLIGPILHLMKDNHPRVRYAAIYAIGQLCTDTGGYLQEEFGLEVLKSLMEVSNSSESRLQAYAAAGTVNFLQTADPEQLQTILPAVFTQLCTLVQNGTPFVKENAMEALTLLARCMEDDFAPLYPIIMPQLINLLEAPSESSLLNLRAKTLDCAATIAEAVDSSIFAPDANRLLLAMDNISKTITEEDEITERYLLRAYAQLAQVVGTEIFKPFISNSFPQLMMAASRKPEMNLNPSKEDEENFNNDDDEWETVELNGELVAIRSAAMEEKAEAVENLMILVQALGADLGIEALQGVLSIAIPLLRFYFHTGVREGGAALVATCCIGLSKCDLPQDQREKILNTVSDEFTYSIASETDPELLAVFIVSWATVFITLPKCLSSPCGERFIKAIESQLTSLVQREQARAALHEVDEDDDLELAEQAAGDSLILESTTGALRNLLHSDGDQLPLQPILPFLALINGTNPSSQYFALRLLSDIIQSTGDASLPLVAPYLERVLTSITSEDVIVRRIAAFAIGIAAETSPKLYSEFVLAGVESLFQSIGPIDMNDNDSLAARDNSIGALSRIIMSMGDKLSGKEMVLSRWIGTLPVLVDGDEMIPTLTLLLELISRGHESVSPTSEVGNHVLKTLVSSIQSEVLPAHLHRPVAEALKSYLSSIPGGDKIDIPAEVEAKVAALLEY